MSGFFSKKSAPVVEDNHDDGTPSELTCTKHGAPGQMICDCKYEILCEDCYKDHSGMEHKKKFISEISRSLPQTLLKKVNDSETFYKSYKNTEGGKLFEAYVDFFEKAKEAAVQLRN